MFGMSLPEIGIILVLALVLLGPERLPDALRTVGKTLREVRKAGNMLRDAIMLEESPYAIKPPSSSPSSSSSALKPAPQLAHSPDLDAYHGPLDQLDDDPLNHSLAHALPHDMPHDPYAQTPSRVEVPLRDSLSPPQDATHQDVALSPARPPRQAQPAIPGLPWGSSPTAHDPSAQTHLREVLLHEQLHEVHP